VLAAAVVVLVGSYLGLPPSARQLFAQSAVVATAAQPAATTTGPLVAHHLSGLSPQQAAVVSVLVYSAATAVTVVPVAAAKAQGLEEPEPQAKDRTVAARVRAAAVAAAVTPQVALAALTTVGMAARAETFHQHQPRITQVVVAAAQTPTAQATRARVVPVAAVMVAQQQAVLAATA